MKLPKRSFLALAGGAIIATGGLAYAAMAPDNDALAISGARVGLQQAVGIAEGHVGGKASRAEFERDKAGLSVFDVEVVKGTTVMDVKVDATSGNVLSSVQDEADKGGERDDD